MISESFILAMDIVGTIAFAISGAMVAIQKKMDIFGVIMLAVTTATGGGILRDLIIGRTPPAAFQDPKYVMMATVTAIIVFLWMAALQRLHTNETLAKLVERTYVELLFGADSLGLAIFTVDGILIGYRFGYQENHFLLIFLGVVTGVGGGVMRDLFARRMPEIFAINIYASASILGAAATLFFTGFMTVKEAIVFGFVTICAIRLIAHVFDLNLPVLDIEKSK